MPKGKILSIINPEKRSGYSEKTKSTWCIMEVSVEKEDGAIVNADTFDTVVDGDIVDLTPSSYTSPKTGKTYDGWNAALPKKNPGGFGKAAVVDNTEALMAIRMVYRLEVENGQKLDKLLGINEGLKAEASAEGEPSGAKPAWADPAETHYEPLPDEPGDITSFMNASGPSGQAQ